MCAPYRHLSPLKINIWGRLILETCVRAKVIIPHPKMFCISAELGFITQSLEESLYFSCCSRGMDCCSDVFDNSLFAPSVKLGMWTSQSKNRSIISQKLTGFPWILIMSSNSLVIIAVETLFKANNPKQYLEQSSITAKQYLSFIFWSKTSICQREFGCFLCHLIYFILFFRRGFGFVNPYLFKSLLMELCPISKKSFILSSPHQVSFLNLITSASTSEVIFLWIVFGLVELSVKSQSPFSNLLLHLCRVLIVLS